jgi:DNA anti-recombination protein RmuC
MELDLELILQILPYVGAVLGWIYKDKILHTLNIKKQKSEIDNSNINNVEEVIKIYRESLDDLNRRNDENIQKMDEKHAKALQDLQLRHDFNLEDIKKKTEEKYQDKIERIESEFQAIVSELEKQVKELKGLVSILTEERDFYKKQLKEES